MLCLLAPHSRLRFIHPVLAANPLVRSRAVGGPKLLFRLFLPGTGSGSPPPGSGGPPPQPHAGGYPARQS